jgi:hypothetical protein
VKRIALFCALLSLAATSHATTAAKPTKVFIMTAQHCDLFQEGTARMVKQNREGMSLEASKFSIENEYLTGPNKLVYSQIKPYLYAVTDEYYDNQSLAEIDYASVIGRNCRDMIGRTAQ